MVAEKQADLHLERWHFAVHCLGIWSIYYVSEFLELWYLHIHLMNAPPPLISLIS